MNEFTYEFRLHFNTPDEISVQRINAVLAAQSYSRLTISHTEPTVVKKKHFNPDGTLDFEYDTPGISEISFCGECGMEAHCPEYDYRLYMTLVPHDMDRGAEAFKNRWNRLHLFSTMCEMLRYRFLEGYVYIVLYHDGRSNEEVSQTPDLSSKIPDDSDMYYDPEFDKAAGAGKGILGWIKKRGKGMSEDKQDI